VPPIATTIVVTKNFTRAEDGSIHITGLLDRLTFNPFPPTEPLQLPIVTQWSNAQEKFTQTVQLLSPTRKVVAEHSQELQSFSDTGTIIHVIRLDTPIGTPGLYRLDLLANGRRTLSKPLGFFDSNEKKEPPIPQHPALTAFALIGHSTSMDVPEMVELHDIFEQIAVPYLPFRISPPLLIGFSYAPNGFRVSLEILDPSKKRLAPKITIEAGRHPVPTHYIQIQPNEIPILESGIHHIRVTYEGKSKLIPIVVTQLIQS
jgi:hypothetical protein